VFGRVERGQYVLDFRTIRRDEIPLIARALLSAFQPAECEKHADSHVLVRLLDSGRRLVAEAVPRAGLIQEQQRLGRGAADVGDTELVRRQGKVRLCHFDLRLDIAQRRPVVNPGTALADDQVRVRDIRPAAGGCLRPAASRGASSVLDDQLGYCLRAFGHEVHAGRDVPDVVEPGLELRDLTACHADERVAARPGQTDDVTRDSWQRWSAQSYGTRPSQADVGVQGF
jgi:hypothetical protein